MSYFCCQWLAKNLQKRRGNNFLWWSVSPSWVYCNGNSSIPVSFTMYFKHHVPSKKTLLERSKLDLDSNKIYGIFLEFLSLKSFKFRSLPDRTFMNSQQRAIFSLDAFLKILLWLTNYNMFYQQINFYF